MGTVGTLFRVLWSVSASALLGGVFSKAVAGRGQRRAWANRDVSQCQTSPVAGTVGRGHYAFRAATFLKFAQVFGYKVKYRTPCS